MAKKESNILLEIPFPASKKKPLTPARATETLAVPNAAVIPRKEPAFAALAPTQNTEELKELLKSVQAMRYMMETMQKELDLMKTREEGQRKEIALLRTREESQRLEIEALKTRERQKEVRITELEKFVESCKSLTALNNTDCEEEEENEPIADPVDTVSCHPHPPTPQTLENWTEQQRHEFMNVLYRNSARKKDVKNLIAVGGDETLRDIKNLNIGQRAPQRKALSAGNTPNPKPARSNGDGFKPLETTFSIETRGILENAERNTSRRLPNLLDRSRVAVAPSPRERPANRSRARMGMKPVTDDFSDLDEQSDSSSEGGRTHSRFENCVVAPSVPARLSQRKKTVAFGSTVPFSQTAEGVIAKKREIYGYDSSSSRQSTSEPEKPRLTTAKTNSKVPERGSLRVDRVDKLDKEESREKLALHTLSRKTDKEGRLERKVATLQNDNEIIRREIDVLKAENVALRDENRAMKADMEDLKSRFEGILELLADVAKPLPSMVVRNVEEPTRTRPSNRYEGYGEYIDQSAPEAVFSVASQRAYDRALSRRQNHSNADHNTPLFRPKGNPLRTKEDSFSDLDEENGITIVSILNVLCRMMSTPQKTEQKRKKTVRFENFETTVEGETEQENVPKESVKKAEEIITVPISAARPCFKTATNPTASRTITERRANITEILDRIRQRRQTEESTALTVASRRRSSPRQTSPRGVPKMSEARTEAEKLQIFDAIMARPGLVEHVDHVLMTPEPSPRARILQNRRSPAPSPSVLQDLQSLANSRAGREIQRENRLQRMNRVRSLSRQRTQSNKVERFEEPQAHVFASYLLSTMALWRVFILLSTIYLPWMSCEKAAILLDAFELGAYSKFYDELVADERKMFEQIGEELKQKVGSGSTLTFDDFVAAAKSKSTGFYERMVEFKKKMDTEHKQLPKPVQDFIAQQRSKINYELPNGEFDDNGFIEKIKQNE
ncbi:hypothetical protein QR680_007135 [Steinernema hermaphroditum]|uniref:Uncharacterized protein n=1 Tax=Steinernema hermaphroditum TaxID=289476 RepID=A0AA39HYZ4_9BILA|nr:hypothetical protein QR680_007135 [Steinernema hermaphroditum]